MKRILGRDRLTPEGKPCSICNAIKPLAEFYNSKASTTGHSSWCKPCFKARISERNKRPERIAYEAEYRATHQEGVTRKNRNWYERNKEKAKADRRAYVRENADSVRHTKRMDKARRRGAPGKYTRAEWDALCAWFGGCCVCCGIRSQLSADHVLPVTRGGLNEIANIQPLCTPCNSRKGTKHIDYRDPDMLRAFLTTLTTHSR